MFNAFRKKFNILTGLFSLMLVLSIGSVSAQSEIVLQNDFEKGTEKWESRGTGSVSIRTSKDQAHGGTKSMKVTGRSASWQGAQLNVTKLLTAGTAYKFTVSVKLNKGESPDLIKMTMQRGDNQFDGVGGATVDADNWTTISGRFKPTGGDPYLLIYIEAGRERTSFFIDDFKIETAGDEIPPQKGVILQTDFEDQTAQNWFVRGDKVEIFSSTAAGSRSLKVAGRTEKSDGVQLDISPLIFKGRTYQISVSARLVQGQPADSMKISMQETNSSGERTFTPITELTPVTAGEWVTLTGEYTGTTSDYNLVITIAAEGATTSFYIDNFVIKTP